MLGVSAPEVAQSLAELASSWSPDAQRSFVFHWLDRCVRVELADFLHEIAFEDEADACRALPPLIDEASVAPARVELRRVITALETPEHLAVALSLATDIDERRTVYGACFGVIMFSRLRHGDDRLATDLRRDLTA